MDPTVPHSSDVLLLKSFLRSFKAEGSAPRTFMAYVGDVGRCQQHLASSGYSASLQVESTAEVSGYL